MKNDREVRPTWVLWWLLAIVISVVCIAFTGVKRAYGQDVRAIKDSKGRVTHTVRTRNDGSREIRDASGRLEGIVRTDNAGRDRVYSTHGTVEYTADADTTRREQFKTF